MLRLPQVTLCCIDTANHALAVAAMGRSMTGIAFARSVFVTDAVPSGIEVPEGVEIAPIAPLSSREAYSTYVLKSLGRHVVTSHVLLVQWDGFVVNPAAWSDEFLDCDYLGAKWFWYQDAMRVGNGGFSLRSKRLLDALADPRITLQGAEDETIGRAFRPLLEREHGIRFGSEALADRFAFEASYPIGKPFGFHGLFNFCRVMSSAEIAAIVPTLSDAVATSPQLLQLMRNCQALTQPEAAHAIAERIVRAVPGHAEATALLKADDGGSSSAAVVRRNAPCPCGSGRKYKQCHGALSTVSAQAPSTVPAQAGSAQPDRARVIDSVVKQGLAAHQSGDLASAETAYQQVLHWDADHPIALHYLGVIHYQRKQHEQALALLERAVARRPGEAEFHNNLGLALAALDRNEEAIDRYRTALTLKPDHAIAWNNLGLALAACNRLSEAIGAYRESLALTPAFGQAHWNLALALLAHGDYEEGWSEYEWRLALPELGRDLATPDAPRWDGRLAAGRTLLLIAEQGLGDALQFARFAQPLAAAGLRVLLYAPGPLVSLLATVPGVEQVITSADSMSSVDAYLPLLSVAGALGVNRDSIPDETPYLRANALRHALLAPRMAEVASGRAKIGLCWAGSAHHANDARRSIGFDRLAPLLQERDIAWFSLQHGAERGGDLIEWSERDNLDDVAAMIAALDLVITVDTSIAHLAGAMARPTWLMLPYAPDWRWGIAGERTPWYPTMRLFRQPSIGAWSYVVADVQRALRQWCEARA